MVETINGEQYYLWRAVDEHGNVLAILMQKLLGQDKTARIVDLNKQLNHQAQNLISDDRKIAKVAAQDGVSKKQVS
jgi:transposase-like protein